MPRRTAKKLAKKKVATEAPPEPTKTLDEEYDSWAESMKTRAPSCSVCRVGVAAETLRALLHSMIRKQAYRIPVYEIKAVIETRHPDAEIGQRGLERHLLTCERELYFRARGRKRA